MRTDFYSAKKGVFISQQMLRQKYMKEVFIL